MEKSGDDKVLFGIVFVLGAFIILSAYDVLHYFAAPQPTAALGPALVWWLISWAFRLAALIGCGVLLMRYVTPGRTAFFLILLGVGLAYALASSILDNVINAGRNKEAIQAAFAPYQEQLKASGSAMTADSLMSIGRVLSVVFRMIGLAIAAVISFFVSTAITGAIKGKAGGASSAPETPSE